MIEKQKLLEILKSALDSEEKSINIYTRHLETALFWIGLDKDKTQKVRALLKRLTDETCNHKMIVEALIKEVKEKNKDAF